MNIILTKKELASVENASLFFRVLLLTVVVSVGYCTAIIMSSLQIIVRGGNVRENVEIGFVTSISDIIPFEYP